MAKGLKALCLSLLASLSLIVCTGCDGSPRDSLALLSGFFSWTTQDWPSATETFLELSGAAEDAQDVYLHDYAQYALAATYLAQDEYDSALARLSEISEEAPSEIRAGVWYQAGLIAYRKEDYERAAGLFRKSLEIRPDAIDAKINLELSRRSGIVRETAKAGGMPGISESGDTGADEELIFNLIRRKEQERWKNQESDRDPSSVMDH